MPIAKRLPSNVVTIPVTKVNRRQRAVRNVRLLQVEAKGHTSEYDELIETKRDKVIKRGTELQSKQLSDPFNYNLTTFSTRGGMAPIVPEYSFNTLAKLSQRSNILRQCIESYVVNIESYGHVLEYVGPEGSEMLPRVQAEKATIEGFLASCSPYSTIKEVREKSRWDLEEIGQRYFEISRDLAGRIVMFDHVPSVTMFRSPRENKMVDVVIEVPNPADPTQTVRRTAKRKFCRFIQVTAGALGTWQRVFFKEFDDPRSINPKTGEEDNSLAIEDQATEILMLSLYTPGYLYGMPRWIGQLPSILGSREAEMLNLNFFRENGIPAMAILIAGGSLTEDSFKVIEDYINAARGQRAMQRIMVLEAAADDSTGSMDKTGPAPHIDMKPMSKDRQQDGLFTEYDKTNRQKISTSFRLPPIFLGECHSEDTEYLTDAGWKIFGAITYERLATFNTDTGAIEYQLPVARNEYLYDGELLHLKNVGVDAMVTPNHRMYVRPTIQKARREKSWQFVEASKLPHIAGALAGYLELPVSGRTDCEDQVSFTIPGELRKNSRLRGNPRPSKNPARDAARELVELERSSDRSVPMDAFLKVVGYFISEGHAYEHGPVNFSQNVGPIADDITQALDDIGFYPSVTLTRGNQLSITICNAGVSKWLRENCGVYCFNKKLPDLWKTLSARQLKILLTALANGDGSIPLSGRDGSFSYSTISKQLADDIQAMCTHIGYVSTIRKEPRILNRQDIYVLYCSPLTRKLIHQSNQIRSVPYNGKVACFTVPNGTLITRRNGRVLISGNSGDYTRATAMSAMVVAEQQVFYPERTMFDDVMNNKILITYKPKYWRYKSSGPPIVDPDALNKTILAMDKAGALTPNAVIKIANKVLDIDIKPVTEEWGDYPFPAVMNYINQGRTIKGLTEHILDLEKEAKYGLPDMLNPGTSNQGKVNQGSKNKKKPKGKNKNQNKVVRFQEVIRRELGVIAQQLQDAAAVQMFAPA